MGAHKLGSDSVTMMSIKLSSRQLSRLRNSSVGPSSGLSALSMVTILTLGPDLFIAIGGGGFIPARILRTFCKTTVDGTVKKNIPIQAVGLVLYESMGGVSHLISVEAWVALIIRSPRRPVPRLSEHNGWISLQ